MNIHNTAKAELSKLTIGSLNKPKTSDVAIDSAEKESPTIPRTGGVPTQLS